MIVRNCRKLEDGDYDFDFSLKEDEVSFLLTYALTSLITHGIIAVKEQPEEQEIQIAT